MTTPIRTDFVDGQAPKVDAAYLNALGARVNQNTTDATSGVSAEGVRDVIGAALTGTGLVSVTPNDGADTITVSTTATQNASDAALRDRATHTGTQASTTIADFAEAVQDAVAAMLVQGTNVVLAYDDTAGTLTLNSTAIGGGGGTGLDAEGARDAIGIALQGIGNINVTVNDPGDTITISTTATANSTDAALRDRGTHTGAQTADTISDLTETVQDIVAGFIINGPNVTKTYDDAANTLTIGATGGGSGGGGGAGTYSQLFGDGTAKTFTITHGRGTTNVIVQTITDATGEVFRCDTFIVDANTVRLEFNTSAPAPDVNEGRVIVQGGAVATAVGITDIIGSGATGRGVLAAATAPAAQAALGLKMAAADVATSESTSSTTYTDLTTTTDTITVTVGPSGCMQVSVAAQLTHSVQNNFALMGFQLSGANTLAADDSRCIQLKNPFAGGSGFRYGITHTLTGLVPGPTTVKLKYRSSGGTATFANRHIGAFTL